MPGLKDIPGGFKQAAYFSGHATAGTAIEHGLFRAPFRCTVTAVTFMTASTITGANTNYCTLNVRNRTTGAGSVVIATLAFTSGVDTVAQTPKTITLSSTAADLILAEDDVITAEKAVAGTGLAMPAGLVAVYFKAS